MLFLEKNPDLFPRPKFCSCKVRTHATEISQLKLMGNVAYVCISKINHLTHTLLYCIRSWGHPLPTCAKKSVSSVNAQTPGYIGQFVVATGTKILLYRNLPTKINGECCSVCISKNKPLNPYPVVLYKTVPPPHLCRKICVLRPAWSSVTSGSYTCIWKSPN